MKGSGLDYMPSLSHDSNRSIETSREFRSRRYGITDAGLAASFGYHLSSRSRGSAAPVSLSDITAPQRARLGDCSRTASDTVGSAASAATGRDPVGEADQQAFKHTHDDPRVRSVFARWSACMAQHSHRYSDPYQAAADKRWSDPDKKPTQEEIATALDDIACKKGTNLAGVMFAVESEYQNLEISRRADELARHKKQLAAEAADTERLLRTYD